MQFKKLRILFYLILITNVIKAQQAPSNTVFRSPVDIPMYLSGNYGELRSGHFHAGIDIKTQGVIGKEVFSIEEGYISRIKISANSYGKALYISHPNGYTSVYAHLDKFSPEVDEFIKNKQYENNEFEVNYFPEATDFPVTKGQLIGLTGNSGSSSGPHLHFEIRESKNQVPLNPLLFNFDIKDNIPPVFYSVYFYPLSNNSLINNKNKKTTFKTKFIGNTYKITDTTKLSLGGKIGIGIELNDFLNGSRNKCGIYTLDLYINSHKIYSHKINGISFAETGYIKSHIDYPEKISSRKSIQKTFVSPNNKLSIYKILLNDGTFNYMPDSLYHIELVAKDVYGNRSVLQLIAEGQDINLSSPNIIAKENKHVFDWKTINTFETEDIKIVIPKNALYDTINFTYSNSDKTSSSISKVHHIHNKKTPVQKRFSIALRVNAKEELLQKAFIGYIDDEKVIPMGGKIVNNFITARTQYFGDYSVFADTLNPIIKPILKNNNILHQNKLSFIISDELSGIKTYNGYIDNNWALFEYDSKNNLLFYTIDDTKIRKNIEHDIELFVTDNVGNITTYHTTFYW